ncbi:hypothetical protein VE01_06529 [Pseudogymnoascus verrucosus]|uniref:Uncharacterized protein n=1 Tax=Pseudogymnoascus verrucosus TaxID=342668 RepID=A0A1B8GIW0_9PEZI|nr:uncharacterized protein VE01_06529 [Pseudogymnoascus verrucosus]OBT95783.2 hypothetical protein VE01_06529 [Pseudogymnoascus verrucosus]
MMDDPRSNLRMHDIASHLPLMGGLEIGLPPEQQPYMERIPPYFVNKELPPIPKFAPEPVLLPPPTLAPPIPPYNPLRFSRVRSNGFPIRDTVLSPPLGSTSSEISLSRVPSLSHSRHVKSPKTLRLLGSPTLSIKTPTHGETDKVRQLTGYDLASPVERRHDRKPSTDSASTSSSCYSDPEIHLRSGRESQGPGGYIGLHHSPNVERHYTHNKTYSASAPGTQRRVSKRYSKITLDDLLQRQCARFQHDTLSPTSSRVHSPNYSTAQSLNSTPETPPFSDAPHASEFTLPLRIRPSQSNEEPASRFSDASTPPVSPTTRFSAGIRDSVLSIAAHAPFGHTRAVSRLLERRGDKNASEELFIAEESSGSEDEAMMGGTLQKLVGRKRDADYDAGIEGSGKRWRGGGLMRKISDAVFPRRPIHSPKSDEKSGSGLGIVIPDHRRKVDGPDTPMPAIGNGKGWVEGILSREASMRRRQSVRGAIGRAAESRWVVGGDERRERRRERLKGQIKVIGLMEVQEDEEMAELRI